MADSIKIVIHAANAMIQSAGIILLHAKIQSYLKKTVLGTLAFSLIAWSFSRILVAAFSAIDVVGGLMGMGNYFDVQRIHDGLEIFITAVPIYVLILVRYVYPYPLDRIFLESLLVIADKQSLPTSAPASKFAIQELGAMKKHVSFQKIIWALYYNPRGSVHHRLISATIRRGKRLLMLLFLTILASFPIIGGLVWPISTAIYLYKTHGAILGLGLFVCGLITPFKIVLTTLSDLRTLNRELLEPLFCRTNLKWKDRSEWFFQNQLVMYGATSLIYPMLKVPILGPAAFVILQGCVAGIALEYFDFSNI